jgi:hypothetical protein
MNGNCIGSNLRINCCLNNDIEGEKKKGREEDEGDISSYWMNLKTLKILERERESTRLYMLENTSTLRKKLMACSKRYYKMNESTFRLTMGWIVWVSNPHLRKRFFCSLKPSRPDLGFTHPPIQWVPGCFSWNKAVEA